MREFTESQLKQQEAVITRVLQTGSKEELAKLSEAEKDPDLNPQIKKLIEECKTRLLLEDAAGDSLFCDKKPSDTIDLNVARLANEVGGKEFAKIAVEIDQKINK